MNSAPGSNPSTGPETSKRATSISPAAATIRHDADHLSDRAQGGVRPPGRLGDQPTVPYTTPLGIRQTEVPESGIPRLLFTPEEAAESLSIGRTRIYELIRSGDLESLLIGRSRRIEHRAHAALVAAIREGAIEI